MKAYLKNSFRSFFTFNPLIQVLDILGVLFERIGKRELRIKLIKKKNNLIMKFISKNFDSLYNQIEQSEVTKKHGNSETIWTCWWQGEEKAPPLVKKCIYNLRNFSDNREVIVITLDNFRDYVDIDAKILEKVKSQKISYTHFSDILRFKLLSEYGGIWIDSTVLCLKTLPLNNNNFFTSKYKSEGTNIMINLDEDRGLTKWNTYSLGGNSILFTYVSEFLSDYAIRYNSFIDYFLIDFFIEYVYKRNEEVRNEIDGVPLNNVHVWDLQNLMNQPFSKEKMNLISDNTMFYKLTYKKKYNNWDINQRPTFYKTLIDE
ncbi:hypothetical protein EFE32_07390 [Lactococcus lactis subsp. lactis]|uniref:capsular polysaccharide synthesis protein n=1 Tax=Lactococcus lactis TaxID=1358 RepID=UPI00223B7841|nr:capsular polysaccharide synthesis protein [Lactococcus lactis]MCT0016665.1 hypothetical protein [Lactococcus lactis subsp. lactis]